LDQVTLAHNHFKIALKANNLIYLYDIKTVPEVGFDAREIFYSLMGASHKSLRTLFGQFYTIRGRNLIAMKDFSEQQTFEVTDQDI